MVKDTVPRRLHLGLTCAVLPSTIANVRLTYLDLQVAPCGRREGRAMEEMALPGEAAVSPGARGTASGKRILAGAAVSSPR